MEPNYSISNFVIFVLPFLCYHFGIVVRKIVLPGPNSPPYLHQHLIGIPMSLAIVCPLLPILKLGYGDITALGITLGIIMEHGMLVNETMMHRLKEHAKNIQNPRPPEGHT